MGYKCFVLLNGIYKLRAKADLLKRNFKVGWEERKRREAAIGRGGLSGGKRKDV